MATRELPAWLKEETGVLHFNVPLFLREAGIRDTPENREAVDPDVAARIAADYWPGIPVQIRP